MIRLRNNPVEGSSLKLGLSFRDPLGNYFIPISVNYTLLALNSDKESWSVVDGMFEVPLKPASSIALVIPDLKVITETELDRKVIIKYQAYIDDSYANFIDEVAFELQPMPTVVYPDVPDVPETYVTVLSCFPVNGSVSSVPLLPTFRFKVNMPCDKGTAVIIKDGIEIPCGISSDATGTEFSISPETGLARLENYLLRVSGFVSKVGGYEFENPYELNFTTISADPTLQPNREFTAAENGEFEIMPEGTFDGMAKVTLTVDVNPPLQEKTRVINGEVLPDEGYYGLSKVTVNVPAPEEQAKEITIVNNGVTTVLPDSGKVLSSVEITTNVPQDANIEENHPVTYTANGTYTVAPSSGYDGILKATVKVDVPEPKIQNLKTVSVSDNGEIEITPDSPNDSMEKVIVDVNVVPEGVEPDKEVNITSNGDLQIFPSSGFSSMSRVTASVNVPAPELENNRAETIDVSSYTTPVEITPSSPYPGMEKATVSLTGIPVIESDKAAELTSNGEHIITPSSGNDGMAKATVTVAVPLQENKEVNIVVPSGDIEIEPDGGYAAMEKVTAHVAVPIESGKTETITANGTTTISPSTGNIAMEDVEVTVAVPLEGNKAETIDVEDYTNPVEITPTAGNDGMEKATVTLANLTRLYVWKDSNASPNPHYMYTTFSSTSKSTGHAFQCGTVKNALLTAKNVEVNGEALYVSGYPNSLYYRDSSNDIAH